MQCVGRRHSFMCLCVCLLFSYRQSQQFFFPCSALFSACARQNCTRPYFPLLGDCVTMCAHTVLDFFSFVSSSSFHSIYIYRYIYLYIYSFRVAFIAYYARTIVCYPYFYHLFPHGRVCVCPIRICCMRCGIRGSDRKRLKKQEQSQIKTININKIVYTKESAFFCVVSSLVFVSGCSVRVRQSTDRRWLNARTQSTTAGSFLTCTDAARV